MTWADITGRGAICGAGLGVDHLDDLVFSDRSAVGPLPPSKVSALRLKTGAPVIGFDPAQSLDKRLLVTTDRFSQFAWTAAQQAWTQAGLDSCSISSERIGVVIGTANIGVDALEKGFERRYLERKRPSPLSIPISMGHAPASLLSMELGAKGPVFAPTTACASGAHAILLGLLLIRMNLADVVVAGGTDSCFSESYLSAWDALKVVSPDVCRPFSLNRRGLVIGEGAGVLILERPGRALARGITPIAKLLGGGMSSDASELLAPNSDGMRRAMSLALRDAQVDHSAISYINAHGTGTIANDHHEAKAISEIFGEKVPVSSTKGAIGHTMGASGALEAIISISALRNSTLPANLNTEMVDPECRINVITRRQGQRNMRRALSNSFAFGGLNVSLIFERDE